MYDIQEFINNGYCPIELSIALDILTTYDDAVERYQELNPPKDHTDSFPKLSLMKHNTSRRVRLVGRNRHDFLDRLVIDEIKVSALAKFHEEMKNLAVRPDIIYIDLIESTKVNK